jgi:putative lipoic acid-binding regulatory protein
MSEAKRIKTALVSVYHKEGLDEIITKLHEEGVELKVSAKGKFKSYTLSMLVHNEDDRKEIFRMLGQHSDIKMVL